jgi:hypothetical protein
MPRRGLRASLAGVVLLAGATVSLASPASAAPATTTAQPAPAPTVLATYPHATTATRSQGYKGCILPASGISFSGGPSGPGQVGTVTASMDWATCQLVEVSHTVTMETPPPSGSAPAGAHSASVSVNAMGARRRVGGPDCPCPGLYYWEGYAQADIDSARSSTVQYIGEDGNIVQCDT